MFAYMPIFHSAVFVTVIFLRHSLSRPGLVLVVILSDHRHQRSCVAVIEHDLPCSSALQGFIREFLYRRKSVSNRHLIEMVEKVQCSFLILRGELMRVIAFDQGNSVSAVETLVQPSHFADGFA